MAIAAYTVYVPAITANVRTTHSIRLHAFNIHCVFTYTPRFIFLVSFDFMIFFSDFFFPFVKLCVFNKPARKYPIIDLIFAQSTPSAIIPTPYIIFDQLSHDMIYMCMRLARRGVHGGIYSYTTCIICTDCIRIYERERERE